MKNRIYIYILWGLFFVIPDEGYARNTSSLVERDTTQCVAIRFEAALNEVDSAYADNRTVIAGLDSLLADTKLQNMEVLTVTSYVLPQGNAKFNAWLAGMRTVTVKDFLKQRYPHLLPAKIRSLQIDDAVEIRRAMTADPKLDRTDIQISWRVPVEVAVSEEKAPQPFVSTDAFTVSEARKLMEAEIAPVTTEPQPIERKTVLAVKNNLLYDLALAPNIEIEVPMGQRWSLNTEYKCPWWLSDSRDFCYQLLSGGIEARCWLGNRRHRTRLTGHFIGLYAEGGVYDFQFGGDGYQGKYYGASGLTYGYSRQIARRLALEFSFGVGYLTTEYRKYTLYQEDLIWASSGNYNFIGPTKAKISLVWLITTRR